MVARPIIILQMHRPLLITAITTVMILCIILVVRMNTLLLDTGRNTVCPLLQMAAEDLQDWLLVMLDVLVPSTRDTHMPVIHPNIHITTINTMVKKKRYHKIKRPTSQLIFQTIPSRKRNPTIKIAPMNTMHQVPILVPNITVPLVWPMHWIQEVRKDLVI